MDDHAAKKSDGNLASRQPPAKKKYHKPVFTRLGSLRELTMALTGSVNDGITTMRGTIHRTGRGGRNGISSA